MQHDSKNTLDNDQHLYDRKIIIMIYGLIFDYHCILVRYRSLVLFKEFGSIVHKIFSKKGLINYYIRSY